MVCYWTVSEFRVIASVWWHEKQGQREHFHWVIWLSNLDKLPNLTPTHRNGAVPAVPTHISLTLCLVWDQFFGSKKIVPGAEPGLMHFVHMLDCGLAR